MTDHSTTEARKAAPRPDGSGAGGPAPEAAPTLGFLPRLACTLLTWGLIALAQPGVVAPVDRRLPGSLPGGLRQALEQQPPGATVEVRPRAKVASWHPYRRWSKPWGINFIYICYIYNMKEYRNNEK